MATTHETPAEYVLTHIEALSAVRCQRLIDLWTETIATLEARERTPDEEQELTFARLRLATWQAALREG